PVAAECDREARFPMQLMDKAREVGLVNVTVPEKFGGGGLGLFELVLVTQELAWACAGINGGLSLNSVIADVFHVAGTLQQKESVFQRLANGE
ncbi:MAG: acyl-CoA dehydrogenase, partial [Burkholderiales bacterium]|nr:acyl-CoA dehydrogenase [Burkholderiales bacterium]